MAKYSLGIDPGLTHTGIALLSGQDLVTAELLLVHIPKMVKVNLETNADAVNFKIFQTFDRVSSLLSKLMKDHRIASDDILCTIEGFWYRPDGNNNRKRSAYDTVAGVTAVKCALMRNEIPFVDIMPVQVKRIVSWLASGIPEDSLDKDEIGKYVAKLLGPKVGEILKPYAQGCHEHLTDSMGIAYAGLKLADYQAHMKIPLKKRKLMYEELRGANAVHPS